ncbi:Hypothetical_protein [Hexamita inflata]|uniref:Hypothetical_protein n=1 Tax=Hexamita inflata TaxID=28002 RepID=A0AA86NIG5_9EUKA|nr:Hypothetical protein HINF_LOCUS7511 [Hexamita inflata]CAI9977524.1 Hypothetical protein HINF_LOCUS65169 [Hexamita inflata]
MSPLRVYKNPVLSCCCSYFSICCLSVGIPLVIDYIQYQDPSFGPFGILIGGAISVFFGVVMGIYSITSCCLVQSCTYIMFPCCLSESQRKALEEQVVVRTPMFNVVDNAFNKLEDNIHV